MRSKKTLHSNLHKIVHTRAIVVNFVANAYLHTSRRKNVVHTSCVTTSVQVYTWKLKPFSQRQSFLLYEISQDHGHILANDVKCSVHASSYTAFSSNFEGNILKEFQLSHHHSIRLVLLISHLVTKAQLQWEKKKRMPTLIILELTQLSLHSQWAPFTICLRMSEF